MLSRFLILLFFLIGWFSSPVSAQLRGPYVFVEGLGQAGHYSIGVGTILEFGETFPIRGLAEIGYSYTNLFAAHCQTRSTVPIKIGITPNLDSWIEPEISLGINLGSWRRGYNHKFSGPGCSFLDDPERFYNLVASFSIRIYLFRRKWMVRPSLYFIPILDANKRLISSLPDYEFPTNEKWLFYPGLSIARAF